MSDETQLETWQNASKGRIGVKTKDRWGEWKTNTLRSGAKIQLSTAERQWNSEKAASAKQDVFRNGFLVPIGDTVKILDGTEDAKDIASNPNLLSESDLRNLFKKGTTQKAFAEKVSGITNTSTLRRLLDMTEDEDLGATVKHQKIVQNRLVELEPDLGLQEIDQVPGEAPPPFRPVSPV
jgi:hypothetical protein